MVLTSLHPNDTPPLFTFIPLKVPTKAVYLPGVGAKRMGAKQFRTRVRKKVFEVGPKKEECEKGGGCEMVRKGGCGPVSHPGAKKIFRALRARTHL